MERISVMVVDDHPMVRQGVGGFLSLQPDLQVVAEAGNSAEAVRFAAEHQPLVALMDLTLPDQDGITTMIALRAVSPSTRVLLLSSFHEPFQVRRALESGATGYLLKDIEPEELVSAIRRAAAGVSTLSPRIVTQLVESMQPTPKATSGPELSAREHEVLVLVAQGHNNASIADRLGIGEKTVKTHVSSILFKLDLVDRTQAAAYAWRQGLVEPRPKS